MSHLPFTLTYLVIAFALSRLFKLTIDPLTLVVFALATYRLGRAVAFNAVFEWLRQPFTKVVPHDSGADDECVADGKPGSVRFALGELLTCPICSGTWSALALLAVYLVDPAFGRLLVYALGLAGAAELLHWRSEYDQWQGRAGRSLTGSYKVQTDIWTPTTIKQEIEQ